MKGTSVLFIGVNVKESVLKAIKCGQVFGVMYISKSGIVTKRSIKVMKIIPSLLFPTNTKRTFIFDSVLALIPIESKENMVI